MRPRVRLGEMLVSGGLLTTEQLEKALVEQRREKLKLGEYLTRSGLVRENDIVECISRQLRIPRYAPGAFPVDPALAQAVPAEMARQHSAAPLRRRGRVLSVAMVDPLDIEAMDAMEFHTQLEVEPVVCTAMELNQIVGTLYGAHSGLGDVLESIEDAKGDAPDDHGGHLDVEVGGAGQDAGEAPVVLLLNSILAQAVGSGVSDVHISPERDKVSVRFRVDGRLQEVPAPPRRLFLPLVSRVKLLAGMDIAVSRVPQDGRFTVSLSGREVNIRASCMPTIHGENVVLRLLDMSFGGYTLEQLGLDPQDQQLLASLVQKPHGMILATGPTGSGKSTSLYAILRQTARPDINVVTLEDPVEFRIAGIRQVQLNRKAGMTFASGLRAVLRQDPDVIMVGEIRDSETASIAVQSALTGHRVLSTVHTNDAAGVFTRLLDMGIEPFLVASVVVVSMAQRLLRTVCPICAEEYAPDSRALEQFGIRPQPGDVFRRGTGCVQCMQTGYRGRTGIYEILTVDAEVQDMIVRRAPATEITRTLVAAGRLRTLKQAAAAKVRQGVATLEEAALAVMG